MHYHTSVLVGLLLIGLTGAGATICFQWNNTICEPFVPAGSWIFGPPFVVPGPAPIDTIALLTVNMLNALVQEEPCRSLTLHVFCLTALRQCVVLNNETIPLPVPPCLDLCQDWVEACQEVWARLQLSPGRGVYPTSNWTAPFSCFKEDPDAQYTPLFANLSSEYNYNGTNITVPCNAQNSSIRIPYNCQDPLVLSPEGNQCAFGCPLPSLSDDQYASVKIMQGIVGWFSWVLSALLILTHLLDPEMRAFPKNLITMVTCAANIAAGAIVLPSYAGYDNIWCGDQVLIPEAQIVSVPGVVLQQLDVSFNRAGLVFGSAACTFQGAILQFGFLSAAFWWVIIAFNISYELYFSKINWLVSQRSKWIRFTVYLFFGWGLSFLFVVIPASADRIKFASSATYCFVSAEEENRYQLAFWFVPVGLSLLTGAILFLMSLIRLVIVGIKLRKIQSFVTLYCRLLVFLFLYMILFSFIFAYNIQIEADSSNINEGYEKYYACLIRGITPCELSDSVTNYDLIMLKGFAISSLGLFLFFIFLSPNTFRFWYGWIKYLAAFLEQRDKASFAPLWRMMVTQEKSLSLASSGSLATVTVVAEEENSGEIEEGESSESEQQEEEEEETSGESASSSSSD